MQRRLAFIVFQVQSDWVWSQNVLSHSLAIRVWSPVKRCALAIVQWAEGNFILEIQEDVDFVVLSCQMKSIKPGFSFSVDVGSLLVKVFYSLQVAHVSGVQKRCESFLVFLIEPLDDLLLVIFLVDLFQTFLGLSLSAIQFYGMMNVKFDNIEMVFVCQFVQDVIDGFIKDIAWIEVFLLAKELINLGQISTFKKDPFGLFLLLLR